MDLNFFIFVVTIVIENAFSSASSLLLRPRLPLPATFFFVRGWLISKDGASVTPAFSLMQISPGTAQQPGKPGTQAPTDPCKLSELPSCPGNLARAPLDFTRDLFFLFIFRFRFRPNSFLRAHFRFVAGFVDEACRAADSLRTVLGPFRDISFLFLLWSFCCSPRKLARGFPTCASDATAGANGFA